ncbi:MAG: O-antigen ligase family protein [Acidobacteria bacterium]|nr:O-antigen ligase family protein [Acidobacteriota bacterium]
MSLSRAGHVRTSVETNTQNPTRSFAWLLERAVVGCLFLFAVAAPHSIAATQTAWLLALAFCVARYFVRPRPAVYRTPLDYALLGFFILTFLSALLSYDPDVSIGKMRAASLFTIVYAAAEGVRSTRVLRSLVLVLVVSCMVNVLYTFGAYAAGRGVKVESLTAESPLRAAGVREGDTLLAADGVPLGAPEELVRALSPESTATGGASGGVRVQLYRVEALPVVGIRRDSLLADETAEAEARLGINSWSRGRDQRATGFYGHYTTYAESLQLVGSIALGLLVALRRKRGWPGALLALAFAGLCGALLLTVTRASWLGLLLSAFVIVLVGARRRTLLVAAGVAVPLAVAGLLVLQQKRQVGFIDTKEGSTAWRLMVYRESLDLLTREPRHMLVGVGMDSIKRHYREWGLFDKGRQNWSHLHSTPLQIAVERGLPALLVWLALVFLYARLLWRQARRGDIRREGGQEGGQGTVRAGEHWVERGLALGAFGGLVGFLASGMVHYNLGDSEVVMIFYFLMGLALAAERLGRTGEGAQEGRGPHVQSFETPDLRRGERR